MSVFKDVFRSAGLYVAPEIPTTKKRLREMILGAKCIPTEDETTEDWCERKGEPAEDPKRDPEQNEEIERKKEKDGLKKDRKVKPREGWQEEKKEGKCVPDKDLGKSDGREKWGPFIPGLEGKQRVTESEMREIARLQSQVAALTSALEANGQDVRPTNIGREGPGGCYVFKNNPAVKVPFAETWDFLKGQALDIRMELAQTQSQDVVDEWDKLVADEKFQLRQAGVQEPIQRAKYFGPTFA